MIKKIVITGGLGYIGTELCKIYSPPVVGPSPGKTPKIKPNKVPKNKTIISFELNRGTNINNKLSI